MAYLPRKIKINIERVLNRGKSVLLLGPRQTGKTTLILEEIKPDIHYSFVEKQTRLRFEKDPTLLEKELQQAFESFDNKPLVFIDEVQKIPSVMDTVQHIIDNKQAQFILSGSSARKLKHGPDINLLPGRVVKLAMDPLHLDEFDRVPDINALMLYGALPEIVNTADIDNKELDLYSYVTAYLEDEVRAEALVRNVGDFARFLEVAASEAGNIMNASKLSQVVGVASKTIGDYFQILEDCMIAHRIDPIIHSTSRRRLIKSPKYIFFDMGVRRVAANEGLRLPQKTMALLFEHYVGVELLQQAKYLSPRSQLKYWRDSAGAEIDFVLEISKHLIPIEVKWSETPDKHDAKHLNRFLKEYDGVDKAYIICCTPRPMTVSDNITAISWRDIPILVKQLMDVYL